MITKQIDKRKFFFSQDAKRVDENLNRLIVTRCEIDMLQIKIEYEHLFRRTLYAQIKVLLFID